MDCNEVKLKWESYTNGECSAEEERQIEEHLQTCPKCEKWLNEHLEKQEKQHPSQAGKNGSKDLLHQLPIKKQRKLMRKAKWKNRLMNALTLFMLFILVSIFTGILTSVYYGLGGDNGKGVKATDVVRTATQMTMPNVYLGSGGMNTNFYFTMDMDYHIQKQLGSDSKAIGQLHGKMLFNLLNVNRDWAGGQYDVKLSFLFPGFVENQSAGEVEFYQETLMETWDTLDLLPEGTVSEMAITFDQLYDIDDVYDILAGYDLDIVWYAIDTGTEEQGGRHRSPYLSASTGIWGFHEWSVFDFIGENGSGSIQIRGDGERRAEAFKKGLHLLAENEKLVKRYIWDIDRDIPIQARYHYVVQNGVKTYGVVVTGPTKELLTLQENEHILFAALGEVDFWNWNSRTSKGTIYN